MSEGLWFWLGDLRSRNGTVRRPCHNSDGDRAITAVASKRRLGLYAAVGRHFVVVVQELLLLALDIAVAALQLLQEELLVGKRLAGLFWRLFGRRGCVGCWRRWTKVGLAAIEGVAVVGHFSDDGALALDAFGNKHSTKVRLTRDELVVAAADNLSVRRRKRSRP